VIDPVVEAAPVFGQIADDLHHARSLAGCQF
jgi:hypothetical protein